MPAIDPIAVRVARRYLARGRTDRSARQVQRRREGLATVREDDEDNAPDAGQSSTACAARNQPSRPRGW